jgi:hypothetical protein
MSNRDPYTDGPAERGWSAGSVAAAVVAVILVTSPGREIIYGIVRR